MKIEKLSQIDPNCFKSFIAASETLNYTHAAAQIGLTQSGISQHIGRLEEQLGTNLFIRVGKKLHLTSAGKELKNFIELYNDSIGNLFERLNVNENSPKGRVFYAMPESCLLSPHFSMLLQSRKKHFPLIDLNVQLMPSEAVFDRLIKNEIDFGFVTKKIASLDIEVYPFCEEEYVLVTSNEITPPLSLKDLKKLSWIDYPGADVIFECWSAHYFPKESNLNWRTLNKSGDFNSIHAALPMLEHGEAATVLPFHCIEKLLNNEQVKIHFRKKTSPCKNMIYVINLKDTRLSKRVLTVVDFFKSIKKT